MYRISALPMDRTSSPRTPIGTAPSKSANADQVDSFAYRSASPLNFSGVGYPTASAKTSWIPGSLVRLETSMNSNVPPNTQLSWEAFLSPKLPPQFGRQVSSAASTSRHARSSHTLPTISLSSSPTR